MECKLQPEGWLLSVGSGSARKTQHHPNSSGAIHSWIKWSGMTFGVSRTGHLPFPLKDFLYHEKKRICWRDL